MGHSGQLGLDIIDGLHRIHAPAKIGHYHGCILHAIAFQRFQP